MAGTGARRLGVGITAAACVAAVVLVGSAGAAAADEPLGATAGVPWTGGHGVLATTLQLMTAPPVAVAEDDAFPAEEEEEGRDEVEQNPSAQHVPGSITTPLGGPSPSVILPTESTFLAAQLGIDSERLPPDTMGAVGPSQYLVTLNNRIRVFDKNAPFSVGALDIGSDAFFADVSGGRPTADPHVRYDSATHRWYLVMITVEIPNKLLIAVSDGPVITPATVWTRYAVAHDEVGPTPNADSGCFADFPTLGIDANALYVGMNMMCIDGQTFGFKGTTGFVVRKSSLVNGGPIVLTAFRQLAVEGGEGPFSPQGVDDVDGSTPNGYFVGVSLEAHGELMFRRVTDPGGTPSISENIDLTVPATEKPLAVPHAGGPEPLDPVDDRLEAATLRDGVLWTSHNVGVDASGVSTPTADRTAARWYRIGSLDTEPTLLDTGTIFDPAAGPRQYLMPSVMVTGQGHAVMGMTTAGVDASPDAAVSRMLAGDTAFSTPEPYTASTSTYNPTGDGADRDRWGDFSSTTLDPCDQQTVYTIQEWASATDTWGVQVAKVPAPPPAQQVTATPDRIPVGTPSARILVTGAGFFDPGPAFECHLTGSVPGLVVNRVTYVDPAHVELDVSTIGVPLGPKEVTITNPDGQPVTSAGLFRVADMTPPLVAVISPLDHGSYALGQMVNVAYSCFDPPGGSGLATCEGSTPNGQPLDTTTLGAHELRVRAVDGEGNETVKTASYTVEDRLAPAIAVSRPVDGGAYTQNELIGSSYTCSDEPRGSGVKTCAGPVASGAPFDTSSVGAHVFTVATEDVSGNKDTKNVHYTVVPVPATPATPDLHVAVSANVTTVPAIGGDVVYTFVVSTTNASVSLARLRVALPAGFTPTRAPDCVGAAPSLTCDLRSIAQGNPATVTIRGTVGQPGELVVNASVESLIETEAAAARADDVAMLRIPVAPTAPAHPGPPVLQRSGGSFAPPLVARSGRVATSLSIDEPATLRITAITPRGAPLSLLAGSKVGDATTGRARTQLLYGVDTAGTLQLRLRLRSGALSRNRTYRIVIVATAADGQTSRLVIPFRA